MILIGKNKIKYVLFLLILMEPGVFKLPGYEVVDNVYTVLKLTVYLFLFVDVVYIRKISIPTIIVIIYEAIIFFSTLINGNGYAGFRVFAGPALAAVGVTVLFDVYKEKIGLYMRELRNIFLIYVTINFLTVLYTLASESLKRGKLITIEDMPATQYFFGMDNRFVFYFIPAIVSALICCMRDKKKKDICILWYVFLQGFFSVFIVWSAGAMIVMIILGVFLLTRSKFIPESICNVRTFIVGWLSVDAILILSLDKVSVYLTDVAEKVLSKGANFNHRVRMWSSAMRYIKESPFIGVGVKTPETFKDMLVGVSHTHNLLLNIVLRGGIFALVSFVAVLLCSTSCVYAHKSEYIAKCMSFALLCCFVLSMADCYDDIYFYMILGICSCYEHIVAENGEKSDCEKAI